MPQVLLKRFASKIVGDKYWIWKFRPGTDAIEVSIKDAAVSKNFYGGEETGVEAKLSDFEGLYGTIFRDLAEGRDPNELASELKRMVRDLALRTSSFRLRLRETLALTLQRVGELPSDRQIEERILIEFESNPGKFLEEPLRKLMKGMPIKPEWLLKSRIFLWLVKRALRRLLPKHFRAIHQKAVEGIRQGDVAQRIVQDVQLCKLVEISPLLDRFDPSSWRVCSTPPRSLILGDSCVVAVNSAGEAGALFRFGTRWDSAYLPLSHSSYLVAISCETSRVLDFEELNKASAQIATAEVYSCRWTTLEEKFENLVGTGDFVISSEELDTAIDAAWNRRQ